jgi:hypothetical protein
MPKSELRVKIEKAIEEHIHTDPMVKDEPDLKRRRRTLLRYHMNEAGRRSRHYRDTIQTIRSTATCQKADLIALETQLNVHQKVKHYARVAETMRRMLRT